MCLFFEIKYIYYYGGRQVLAAVVSQTFDLWIVKEQLKAQKLAKHH